VSSKDRPNIIHLISHDMGRHLGCYGAGVATPNYDRLAAMGVRFSNYFCTQAGCSPSRGSISTGRYPHNNGLIGLAHIGWRIRDDVKKMPEYLNELGYRTHLIGQHHESNADDMPGCKDPKLAAAKRLGYQHVVKTTQIPGTSGSFIGNCYETLNANIDEIMGPDSPFFISIGTPGAHRKYVAWKNGVQYEPDNHNEVPVPPYLPDKQAIRLDIAHLNGLVKKEDEYLGQILDLLEEKGLTENTLFVVTTDHGIAMPRAKGTCFDPGLGTFLIMYMKGRAEGGKVHDELLSNVDLLPTYIELAGGEPPADIDGRSFLALLDGKDYAKREDIFAEMTWHDGYDPVRSVRTERFKYMKNFGRRPRVYVPLDIYMSRSGAAMLEECYYFTREPEELYDLENDPLEQTNLAGDPAHAETLERLRTRVENWMQESDDPLLKGDVPPTDKQRKHDNRPYNNWSGPEFP